MTQNIDGADESLVHDRRCSNIGDVDLLPVAHHKTHPLKSGEIYRMITSALRSHKLVLLAVISPNCEKTSA